MNMIEKYGKVALVAGASEGMGAAYAMKLASNGFDLILIARRKDQLEKTSQAIRGHHPVNVTSIPCDLSDSGALEHIINSIGTLEVNFLVYNAALSYIGPYLDHSLEEQVRIASTNMITPLKLVHHFGSRMIAKGKGGIVLMTSLGGLQGSGFIATYAATKAFNLVLAEGLWYEWRNKGVDIIGCCAGATATPNFIQSKPGKLGFIEPQVQTPEAVVHECFQKIGKVPSYITGRGNRVAAFFMRHLISRKSAVTIMGNATRKLYAIDY